MGLLNNIFMNIQDKLSTKTPAERKQEIINSAEHLEYCAGRMEVALLKLRLTGDESNISEMQKAYEKSANKIALNIHSLEEVQGLDGEIEAIIKDRMTPAAERYAIAVRKIATGGN